VQEQKMIAWLYCIAMHVVSDMVTLGHIPVICTYTSDLHIYQ